jgi:hypothetical protein
VQGASQAQEIRTERQVRKGRARGRKLSRTATEGTGGMAAREGEHPERKTRQVEARRKPDFSDNGDAEAGLRGRHQSGARREPNAGRSRREGGSTKAQADEDREPGGPQAIGSWQPQEVKAVRPEQSAEAQAKGRCRRAGGGARVLKPV